MHRPCLDQIKIHGVGLLDRKTAEVDGWMEKWIDKPKLAGKCTGKLSQDQIKEDKERQDQTRLHLNRFDTRTAWNTLDRTESQ